MIQSSSVYFFLDSIIEITTINDSYSVKVMRSQMTYVSAAKFNKFELALIEGKKKAACWWCYENNKSANESFLDQDMSLWEGINQAMVNQALTKV